MQKLNARDLAWPADWAALFGRAAPLILEIGFGRGAFLMHLAQTFPDHNVIGLEISNQCLVAAERTADRLGLANVRVIHATAETALHHLFAPASISQVHINFPDPWFKKGHHKRRLMQRDTLDVIVNRMQPGGLLYLATDILDYAELTADLLNNTPGLDNLLATTWASEMPGRVVTKYEATARREGRSCYYFARRRNHMPGPNVPVVEEAAMPHLVFRSPVTLDEIQAQFAPSDHRDGNTVVKFVDVYRGRHSLLFDTYINEPTIDQRVALFVQHRSNDEYTILLGTLGHPRPTAGVHLAVSLLGDWLTGLHPNTEILRRSLAET